MAGGGKADVRRWKVDTKLLKLFQRYNVCGRQRVRENPSEEKKKLKSECSKLMIKNRSLDKDMR